MDNLWGFLYGVFGGIAAEIATLYKIRHEPEMPKYISLKIYWIITSLMIFCGGILVIIYIQSSDVKLNAVLATNVGASAPLIISRIASGTLPKEPGSVD